MCYLQLTLRFSKCKDNESHFNIHLYVFRYTLSLTPDSVLYLKLGISYIEKWFIPFFTSWNSA